MIRPIGNGFVATVSSPLGVLALHAIGNRLCSIDFPPHDTPLVGPDSALLRRTVQELERYWNDGRYVPRLPLPGAGTDFQQRVWRALCAIPPGETITYGELASRLGSHPRALGQACRANPLPVVVPCHRVIAADGLGGYCGRTAGASLARKRWLLDHEGAL